jgi:hypothetical protein
VDLTTIGIFAGLALLGVATVMHFKWKALFFTLTVASGYLTYVAVEQGGFATPADTKVTVAAVIATLVFAGIFWALVKGGKNKAKAAPAPAHA